MDGADLHRRAQQSRTVRQEQLAGDPRRGQHPRRGPGRVLRRQAGRRPLHHGHRHAGQGGGTADAGPPGLGRSGRRRGRREMAVREIPRRAVRAGVVEPWHGLGARGDGRSGARSAPRRCPGGRREARTFRALRAAGAVSQHAAHAARAGQGPGTRHPVRRRHGPLAGHPGAGPCDPRYFRHHRPAARCAGHGRLPHGQRRSRLSTARACALPGRLAGTGPGQQLAVQKGIR
jgi:hypothetical protein